MRENRLSGSEGGGTGYTTGPSYPYPVRESRDECCQECVIAGVHVVTHRTFTARRNSCNA